MALGLTPEHLELAAAVRGWAERHCPVDVPRAASGQPDGGGQQYRDTLGPSLAAQGVLGLHLPEKHGGQGYGLPELAVATEELGRALLPGAFLPTVLAGAVLASTAIAAWRVAAARSATIKAKAPRAYQTAWLPRPASICRPRPRPAMAPTSAAKASAPP